MKKISFGLGVLCLIIGIICLIYSMAGRRHMLPIALACISVGSLYSSYTTRKAKKKNQETPPESEENPVDKL